MMVINGSDDQNTLLILSIELTYTLTPKLLIHRKYTGMTQTLDCVIRSCLGLLIHRKYTGMTQTLDCVIRSCLG